jgi:hypothetical protein
MLRIAKSACRSLKRNERHAGDVTLLAAAVGGQREDRDAVPAEGDIEPTFRCAARNEVGA